MIDEDLTRNQYVYLLHPDKGDPFQTPRFRRMEVGEVFESHNALWIVREMTEEDQWIPCHPYAAPMNEKWAGKKVLIIGGPLDGGDVMYSGDLLWPYEAGTDTTNAQCYKFSEMTGCYEPMFAKKGSSITSLSNLMKPREQKPPTPNFPNFPNLGWQSISFILLGVHKTGNLDWGGQGECHDLLTSIAKGGIHTAHRRLDRVKELIFLNWDEFQKCATAYYENTQSSSDG